MSESATPPKAATMLMLAALALWFLPGEAGAQSSASTPAPAQPPLPAKPKPAPGKAEEHGSKPPPDAHAKPKPADQPAAKGKPATAPHGGKTHADKHKKGTAPAAAPAAAPVPAPAPPATETKKPEPPKGSGLPLPRFAALRSDEVNMRAGPGTRYPIDWVYKRRDLPVEIEREFEVWRLIRDPEGTKGWVHQATLTGRRTLIVTGETRALRKQPDSASPEIAELKPGVIARIRTCDAGSDWCQIQAGEYRGYLKRTEFWGLLPGEVVTN